MITSLKDKFLSGTFEARNSVFTLIDINNMGAEEQQSLVIDVIKSESVSYTKDMSRYPIETGHVISDNSVISPIRITLNGIVSNHPLKYDLDRQHMSGMAGAAAKIRAKKDGEEQPSFVESAKDFFNESLKPNILLSINVGLGVFNNLSVENISYNRNPDNLNALHFSMSMSEVIFASYIEGSLKALDEFIPREVDVPSVGAGAGTPTSVLDEFKDKTPEEMEKVRMSMAARLLDAITKLF